MVCLSLVYSHIATGCLTLKVGTHCNDTAYRNAVTLQVTDTIRSYELNFYPVPHGVTVSCERYTLGFPVFYGSPSDVFAASSGFVYLYTLRLKGKEQMMVVCHVARPDLLIPLMRRPNSVSAPNKSVMLPRNQLLIRYAVTSPTDVDLSHTKCL